jgi:FPC/CPF motif-containing protein YcgG
MTTPADMMIFGEQPTWGADALERFRCELQTERTAFPCTFAVAAYRRRHLRFAFVDSASDASTWAALPELLTEYLATAQSIAPITSFVVFFRLEHSAHRIDWYESRFWAILQYLHAHDPAPWPADLPRDTEDPHWEFGFGGEPIFVVCNTPAHRRRRSRWSSELVVTFQPRSVFSGLAAQTVPGEAARRTIRKRLRDYDAPLEPSPTLGGYGLAGNREWKQYFLAETNDDPGEARCPLRIQPASA